jgi:hypothetical protein
MQEIDNKARTSNSTGLVLLSTRNIGSYQSIQDMTKADSKSPWGNHISFLHIPIPKLCQASLSNPLEFVWKAQNIIKRKRNAFTVFLIEWLLDMELKLRGHEVGIYLNYIPSLLFIFHVFEMLELAINMCCRQLLNISMEH